MSAISHVFGVVVFLGTISPALAQAPCTPSKSVSAALAEYNANISALDSWLRSANGANAAEYDTTIATELANYNAKLLAARLQLDKEMASSNRDLNWRESIESTKNRYNAATAAALNDYNTAVNQARRNYNTRSADSIAYYTAEAKNFAAGYNQAVCVR